MKISAEVYERLMASYPVAPPETGGVLGMKNGVICAYEHDTAAQATDFAVYVPSVDFLNSCLENWQSKGIAFAGIVHSHPSGQQTLSGDDLSYIRAIYEANPRLQKTFFPLIVEGCGMIVYEVRKETSELMVKMDELLIVSQQSAVNPK